MKESIKIADLSHLSHQVAKAAREFVDLKFRIDTEGRMSPVNIPGDLHGSESNGEWGPFFGKDFFTSIIPFLPRVRSPAENMAVPVAHTLGCSWRLWPDPDISITEKEEVISYINSEHGIQDTDYFHVPELGLFFSGEGKNRVNFCRYHNIEHIPARVSVGLYPDADKIMIYVLEIAGGSDVWAVLDNRYVQKVSHYAYALPLLRAYGVAVLHEWPKDLPTLNELLQHTRYCSDDSHFHRKVIDIRAVREVLDKAAEKKLMGGQYVRCRLIDLPLRKKYVYLAWVTVALMVAVIVWLCFRESVIGGFLLAILAFISGIFAAMTVPILQIRNKYLDD
ncbi:MULTISPECIES: hypothetical protein [unclassified Serratia (in: enterobacteria)]|uniref:hypothetical protein n=1 Tax=unclassified Serratia (in: enterobacteria) TaxID=2647522 RepID=UPI003076139D